MKRRTRYSIAGITTFCIALVSGFAFLRWANEAPPVAPLLKQIPEIQSPTPTNDSPDLLHELMGIHEAKVQPDVDTILETLSKLPDRGERQSYLHAHRNEILAACDAYSERLKRLSRITSYDQVFDPPVPEFRQWVSLNLSIPDQGIKTGDVKALILRSELGISEGDRGPTRELIDTLVMLYKWRNNQWMPYSIITGLSASAAIETYLSNLIDRDDLTPEEAGIAALSLESTLHYQDLLRRMVIFQIRAHVGQLTYMMENPDSPFGEPLSFRAKIERRLGVMNAQLTLYDYLNHNLAVLNAIDAGRPKEAQQIYDEWIAQIRKRTPLRNHAGNRTMLVLLPSFTFDWTEQDRIEAALLNRLKQFASTAQ